MIQPKLKITQTSLWTINIRKAKCNKQTILQLQKQAEIARSSNPELKDLLNERKRKKPGSLTGTRSKALSPMLTKGTDSYIQADRRKQTTWNKPPWIQ